MTKIFIYSRLPGVPLIPELYPVLGNEDHYSRSQVHLQSVFSTYTKPFFDVVQSVQESDFVLYPHWYKEVRTRALPHLHAAVAYAKEAGKPLILSAYGDSDEQIALEHTVVLRYSQYRHARMPNELVVPPYVADFTESEVPPARRKQGGPPIVGFCGRAEYQSMLHRIRAWCKNMYIEVMASITFQPIRRVHKGGIYFRKKMLAALRASPKVQAHFVVRNFFSLNRKTAPISIEQLRREFIQNIAESDFAVTIKGDGNAATRFYEALALGRIPVVFDTDALLPLEDIISYTDFCLFIPYTRIDYGGELIAQYYDSLSPDDYIRKQHLARQTFITYLRADAFYKRLFSSPQEIYSRVTIPV